MPVALSESAPPTLKDAFVSALGYFVAAIASTWAGYAIGHQNAIPAVVNDIPRFIFFLTLLFPAYVNRAILYELKNVRRFGVENQNRHWLKTLSIQFPLVLLLQGLILATTLLLYAEQDANTYLRCIIPR